jgi:hypothetical protein
MFFYYGLGQGSGIQEILDSGLRRNDEIGDKIKFFKGLELCTMGNFLYLNNKRLDIK